MMTTILTEYYYYYLQVPLTRREEGRAESKG